jgi:hypothetical protein
VVVVEGLAAMYVELEQVTKIYEGGRAKQGEGEVKTIYGKCKMVCETGVLILPPESARGLSNPATLSHPTFYPYPYPLAFALRHQPGPI